jgi:hypothetical protein
MAVAQSAPEPQLKACAAIKNYRETLLPLFLNLEKESNPIKKEDIALVINRTRRDLRQAFKDALAPGDAVGFVGKVESLGGGDMFVVFSLWADLCPELAAYICYTNRRGVPCTTLDGTARDILRTLSVGDKVVISGEIYRPDWDLRLDWDLDSLCTPRRPGQCKSPASIRINPAKVRKLE